MSKQETCHAFGDTPLSELHLDNEWESSKTIPELLEKYHKLQLGRAIMIVDPNPVTHEPTRKLGGYILPTSNNLEHMIFLSSGEMYLVGPESTSADALKEYKKKYNSSPLDFIWELAPSLFEEDTKGLSHFIENRPDFMGSKILMTNKTGPSEIFNKKIEDSVSAALHLARQRNQGMDESRKKLLERGVNEPDFTPTFGDTTPVNSPQEINIFDNSSEICLEF